MRVWLFYANVGGGHRGAAQAIAQSFAERPEKFDITYIDLAAGLSPWRKRLFEDGYAWIIDKADWFYRALYFVSQWRPLAKLENYLMTVGNQAYLLEQLKRNQPDIIVSTYFMTQPLTTALRRLKLSIPIVVVVTDPFTIHPIWTLHRDLPHIVLSQQARASLIKDSYVIPENLVAVEPLVNHRLPDNFTQEKLAQFKKDHGLPLNGDIVLLVGGGNGFPKGTAALRALIAAESKATLVIVCGSNHRLKADAEALRRGHESQVIVFGFIDFLPELIAASSLVVTKAGSGVLMEAVAQKKPLIIAHYIWGQEKGNVDYIVDKGLGFYEPRPRSIPKRVAQCLYDEPIRRHLAEAYQELDFKNGNTEIIEHILTLARSNT